ncbi:DUF3576 domain-containing protein [Cribrihabitans pelagius]|uniref:DUF3576 domain-containing protein n=1 Tax=Cribrihabitans pelagius TaxID=1765746 RepID=UPI003B5C9C00
MLGFKTFGTMALLLAAAGCATTGGGEDGSTEGTGPRGYNEKVIGGNPRDPANQTGTSIWDAFGAKPDQNLQVNRYLWTASLDVLSFLPVQSVDPFTGVIITGYGTPPGGGRAYRATVHIKDPALDARALNLSLQTQSGPASAATTRAVEDAILSRARQLRIADKKL